MHRSEWTFPIANPSPYARSDIVQIDLDALQVPTELDECGLALYRVHRTGEKRPIPFQIDCPFGNDLGFRVMTFLSGQTSPGTEDYSTTSATFQLERTKAREPSPNRDVGIVHYYASPQPEDPVDGASPHWRVASPVRAVRLFNEALDVSFGLDTTVSAARAGAAMAVRMTKCANVLGVGEMLAPYALDPFRSEQLWGQVEKVALYPSCAEALASSHTLNLRDQAYDLVWSKCGPICATVTLKATIPLPLSDGNTRSAGSARLDHVAHLFRVLSVYAGSGATYYAEDVFVCTRDAQNLLQFEPSFLSKLPPAAWPIKITEFEDLPYFVGWRHFGPAHHGYGFAADTRMLRVRTCGDELRWSTAPAQRMSCVHYFMFHSSAPADPLHEVGHSAWYEMLFKPLRPTDRSLWFPSRWLHERQASSASCTCPHFSQSRMSNYKNIVESSLGIRGSSLSRYRELILQTLRSAHDLLKDAEVADAFSQRYMHFFDHSLHLGSAIALHCATSATLDSAIDEVKGQFPKSDPTLILAVAALHYVLVDYLAESEAPSVDREEERTIVETVKGRFDQVNWMVGPDAMRMLEIVSRLTDDGSPTSHTSASPVDRAWPVPHIGREVERRLYHLDGPNVELCRWFERSELASDLCGRANLERNDLVRALATQESSERALFARRVMRALWDSYPVLGPCPPLDELNLAENMRMFYEDYRDHVCHSLAVFLLGLYVYEQCPAIRQAIGEFSSGSGSDFREEFVLCWLVTAVYHDVGYLMENEHAEVMSSPTLASKAWHLLRSALEPALQTPLSMMGCFCFTEDEEKQLANRFGVFRPSLTTVSDLDSIPNPVGEGKVRTLELIEFEAKRAGLGATRDGAPLLQRYFDFANTHRPGRPAFRDHGITSATVLLGVWVHFMRYLTTLSAKLQSDPDCIREELSRRIHKTAEDLPPRYETVRVAAAAIALHNISPPVWREFGADANAAGLWLSSFRIHLGAPDKGTPFAFLLRFVDTLQDWDRPRFRAAIQSDAPTLKSRDVAVSADTTGNGKLRLFYTRDERLVSPPDDTESEYSRMRSGLCSALNEDDVDAVLCWGIPG